MFCDLERTTVVSAYRCSTCLKACNSNCGGNYFSDFKGCYK